MGDDTTVTDKVTEETPEETPEEKSTLAWHGILAPMGVLSGDGRRFSVGGITNRDLPIPMLWVEKSSIGHDGAEVVGNIETVTYNAETNLIEFTGTRLDTDRAAIAADQIAQGAFRGVSVDLDSVAIEYVNEDGSPFDVENWDPSMPEPVTEIVAGRIAAATLVAIPAFQEAYVALGERTEASEAPIFEEALTASAAPAYQLAAVQVQYPGEWFLDPEFTAITPLTVTEDGRVFGHLATWGACHLGFSQRDCVTAPHSSTGYGYFLLKSVLTEHGEMPVGALTIDTDHAALNMAAGQAMAHYDDKGSPVAFVNVGEDKHGIWFAGAIRESATAKEIETLRGSTLSGDWRPTPHGQEFVGALGVNVPGFPVPRVQFSQTPFGQGALVAAATVRPHRAVTTGATLDYSRLAASVVDEIEKRQAAKVLREERLASVRDGFAATRPSRDALLARLRGNYTGEH